MDKTLDLDLLRSFAAVAETRSFTRAAERVGRVQSAVSMQIKRLEETLGVSLLDRNNKIVRLTSDGVVLLRHAERMLRLNEQVMADFGHEAVHGRVRVGATDTSMCFLPGALARFAKSHPLVELEIRCDRSWETLDALEADAIDIALVTQSCGRPKGEVVRTEPLYWAIARDSTVDELDPVPLAIFAPGCVYREDALKRLEASGKSYRHAYNSASRDGLNAAVEAGLAVTMIPERLVDGNLRILGTADGFPALPEIEITLHRAPRLSDAAEAFAVSLAETLLGGPEASIAIV